MAKEPIPGQVKSRLCPPLSIEQAAELYAASCLDVIDNALQLQTSQTVIAASPASSVEYFHSQAPSALVLPAEAETIGDCLQHATSQILNQGYERVLAVSSDSPDLWTEILQEGLNRLDEQDLVLGPTADGGYYLIGLKQPRPQLFSNSIDWGTDKVLQQTLDIANQLGLTYTLLQESVTDIDEWDDVRQLRQSLESSPNQSAHRTRAVLRTLHGSSGR
jgi:rSAM/selenodomain-associated transferase 1